MSTHERDTASPIENDLVPDWKDIPEDDNAEPDDAGDDK